MIISPRDDSGTSLQASFKKFLRILKTLTLLPPAPCSTRRSPRSTLEIKKGKSVSLCLAKVNCWVMSLCKVTFTKLSGFCYAHVTLCQVRAHSSRGSWADNLRTGKRQGRCLGFPAIVVQKVVDVGISPAEICLSRGESWPCPKEERAHDKRILKEWYQKALLFDLSSLRLGSQPSNRSFSNPLREPVKNVLAEFVR